MLTHSTGRRDTRQGGEGSIDEAVGPTAVGPDPTLHRVGFIRVTPSRYQHRTCPTQHPTHQSQSPVITTAPHIQLLLAYTQPRRLLFSLVS